MKERPILFSGPMVRAILDGSKHQTRRIVKPTMTAPRIPPLHMEPWLINGEQETDDDGRPLWVGTHPDYPTEDGKWFSCPYGKPGDRLWVRETWAHDGPDLDTCRRGVESDGPSYGPYYKATASIFDLTTGLKWRPSIHMPRWASRINLEITDVQVERLQEISGDDAIAEGIAPDMETHAGQYYREEAVHQYSLLWDHINGAGAWEANPFVWVVAFKRVHP